jgi:ketosteroid isomerase-like protein
MAPVASDLLARFGAGWERGEGQQIADLFTTDGVFIPGPFDAPLKGREAILAYWRDIPMEQAEISFRSGEVYVAGPWFATEFKCTFRRRRTGEKMVVKGALFCETADGLLSEMRMYWDRAADRQPG